jgi:predicted transcriptional regulator
MARKRSTGLTDGETRIMNVLWARGRATVGEVTAALPKRRPVAYTTVQTMLRILESKGYADHEQVGRAFVYRPIVDQHAARRKALGHLIDVLFDHSPSLLVLDLLKDERLDPAEIGRLKQMIDEV